MNIVARLIYVHVGCIKQLDHFRRQYALHRVNVRHSLRMAK